MSSKRALVSQMMAFLMAFGIGLSAGQTKDEAPLQSTDQVNPATDKAQSCTCAPAGSGCSGACPNAPGKKRVCKNTAPAGKPKSCACVVP